MIMKERKLDFDYFKRADEGFKPRTAAAALKGIHERKLPIEAFVYLGTSVKPLNEKPYDLEEIERILAKKDITVETYILLNRIFEDLIKSVDQELALFAAEGMNAIEDRYNKRIEKLREGLRKNPENAEILYQLAVTYYESALLSSGKEAIESFYLREAFSYVKEIVKLNKFGRRELLLFVNILIALRMYDQAFKVLNSVEIKGDPEIIFLKAKVEFYRKNLSAVFQYCVELTQYESLSEGIIRVLNFWVGY